MVSAPTRSKKENNMKNIYGNEYLLSTIANMIKNDKAAQSVIFCGEKGSGKRLMAKYYTMSLMCESPVDGRPCGKCNACHNVDIGYHPDVIYAPTSGKLGGYSVETARAVINQAYIKPNNSRGRKVCIFTDCKNTDPRTQNVLLKLIEEPPEYAYFIFTCNSRTDFLPTIISRCVCFGVSTVTDDEAKKALIEDDCTPEEAESAVRCFHGNIGMCGDYIRNEELRRQVDLTKGLADSIIRKDEYSLNAQLFALGSSRNDVKNVLSMLDKLIRDAAVLGRDKSAELIGCSRENAVALSGRITPYQAVRIHNKIELANKAVDCNVTIPLAAAALAADVIEII